MNYNYSHNTTSRKKTYSFKKQKKLRISRILLILLLILAIFSFYSLRKNYISYRCKNLTYAVDYYFTNWKDKNLRLLGVESITIIENDEDIATIEAVGLSYKTPRYTQTLIGKFVKNKDGSWQMNEISNKEIPNTDTYNN
jgi:hypothetical protein